MLSGMLIFKDLGLCDAIIQSPNLTDRQLSSLFWVNLGIGAVAVFLGPQVAGFCRSPAHSGAQRGYLGDIHDQYLAALLVGTS